MGRAPRVDVGGEVYHVINRANARMQIFFKEEDYQLLEQILQDGVEKYNMHILAYCIMPNHFHLVLHPRNDGDLQRFMQWITLTHTQRWHTKHKSIGTGHLYQGRYKSFLIEQDAHLLTVLRYVERNPLRANLVKNITNWKYSSLHQRLLNKSFLAPWPIPMPEDYLEFVETPLTAAGLEAARHAVNRGMPLGTESWTNKMLDRFDLKVTIRERGRPRKGT